MPKSKDQGEKDRISVDISGLRDEIETCRNDRAWQALPLTLKIRVLIDERLEELRIERGK